jgi:hypothetical protein
VAPDANPSNFISLPGTRTVALSGSVSTFVRQTQTRPGRTKIISNATTTVATTMIIQRVLAPKGSKSFVQWRDRPVHVALQQLLATIVAALTSRVAATQVVIQIRRG